jgi:HEPN domain-containing protein
MSEKRLAPDDPHEWLNRAHSNLSQAIAGARLAEVYLEDLCFQAQQAAEKALKAVLIAYQVRFPYTHDIGTLLSLIERAGQPAPEYVFEAALLSDYAVEARYPGVAEPVNLEEYQKSIVLAEGVLRWAEEIVEEHVTSEDHDSSDNDE